jgi:hypothetical protein
VCSFYSYDIYPSLLIPNEGERQEERQEERDKETDEEIKGINGSPSEGEEERNPAR